MHELRLIHTDLKPENILLVSPEYIKVPYYKVYFVLLLMTSLEIYLLLCFDIFNV
jgi:serine/threonine protein kinase